ncbi:DUF1948 domain-containing protein [[Mycoplasma] testudinis]|uniref:DUF1948 domain-containing protein n=1 Tax=[Mycoplasma] testudinis TaxID=33924 RepID=UPI0004890FEF|nr:DUF1948 domain-containing protein [[Mycoplasma] testudinis]
MNNNKQIWAKRVAVFEYIFACLCREEIDYDTIVNEFKAFENTEPWQLKIVATFAVNLDTVVNLIKTYTKNSKWSYEQLDLVLKAILHEVYAESLAHQTPKAVLIDQSLITMDKYGDPKLKKMLHALIDKIIK